MKSSRDSRTIVRESEEGSLNDTLDRQRYESPTIRHLDLARVITGSGGTHLDFETDGSPSQGY